jgi:Protein of unknown function (DUF1236)
LKVHQEGRVKTSFGHSTLRLGTYALVLLGGLAVASAQIGSTPPTIQDGTTGRGDPYSAQLRLSETQKSAIAEAVRRDNKAVEPSVSFVASLGAPVPPVIELYILPDAILADVPAAKRVKYTVVKNQVLLVDPVTMRVLEIIPQ